MDNAQSLGPLSILSQSLPLPTLHLSLACSSHMTVFSLCCINKLYYNTLISFVQFLSTTFLYSLSKFVLQGGINGIEFEFNRDSVIAILAML